MRIVLISECGLGHVGELVTVPDNQGKWAVSAGIARYATLQDTATKATVNVPERRKQIKTKG